MTRQGHDIRCTWPIWHYDLMTNGCYLSYYACWFVGAISLLLLWISVEVFIFLLLTNWLFNYICFSLSFYVWLIPVSSGINLVITSWYTVVVDLIVVVYEGNVVLLQ